MVADYSRLADTGPALLGMLGFTVLILAYLKSERTSQDRRDERLIAAVEAGNARLAEAITGNTAVIAQVTQRNDEREDRRYAELHQLGEACLSDHREGRAVMAGIKADVREVLELLGNGERGPATRLSP